jgi:protein-L-isoaspartate O-methyltransferase
LIEERTEPFHDPHQHYNVPIVSVLPAVEGVPAQHLVMPGDKVLEIGSGSGYLAAVLAHLTPDVHTIEIVEDLARMADGSRPVPMTALPVSLSAALLWTEFLSVA